MASGVEGTGNEIISGANTDATPQVDSRPAAGPLAKTWKAPDVSHPGHIHVNTSHLTTAADVIKARLSELDEAVNAVKQHMDAFSSLSGWTAGASMKTRLEALVQQCAALGKEQSDVNAKAALDLSRSAEEYDEKESATKKAFDSLGSAINDGSNVQSAKSDW